LNTPSLKKELEKVTNSAITTVTQPEQSVSTGAWRVSSVSAPAIVDNSDHHPKPSVKPAPWAQSGEVSQGDHMSAARARARSWACSDDSDSDEEEAPRNAQRSVLPDRSWPEKFRESNPPDYPPKGSFDSRNGPRNDVRSNVSCVFLFLCHFYAN
jgi:hypothetical protein